MIPKGTRAVIGADGLVHYFYKGLVQDLDIEEVKGYDPKGLAEYLLTVLKIHFPISEMLDDYDFDEKELKKQIEDALYDLGF